MSHKESVERSDSDADDFDADEGGSARTRTLRHMQKLLAGATASIVLAGCSSRDATPSDAGPAASGSAPAPSSAETSASATVADSGSASPSASAAPSASSDIKDAGPDAAPVDAGKRVVRPPHVVPVRRPSGYEVVDMLPPPPMLLIMRRRKKKPKKSET